MQDKPWRNEDLRKCEEALPRLKGGDWEKASRLYKAKTGVECDGFHPNVLLDLTKETRGKVVEFSDKVAQCGRWPQQACTTMFFLIPKNVTSERPAALVPTSLRWWEALRAPEVAKWQQKYRVDLGRYRRAKWRSSAHIVGSSDGDGEIKAKADDQRAVALVQDLAKAFERVSLPVVWAWATHFSFPRKILRVLCGYFEHPRRVQFEGSRPFSLGRSGVACFCVLCCKMR